MRGCEDVVAVHACDITDTRGESRETPAGANCPSSQVTSGGLFRSQSSAAASVATSAASSDLNVVRSSPGTSPARPSAARDSGTDDGHEPALTVPMLMGALFRIPA